MRGLAIKFVQISDFGVVRILLESVDRDWPSLSKCGSSLNFPFVYKTEFLSISKTFKGTLGSSKYFER